MDKWSVKKIAGGVGRDYIRRHHYTRSCHNGPMCYGLFDPDGVMAGVCAFATPSSEAVRAAAFGIENKDRVTELHRLYVRDGTPENAESWFVSRALKLLLRDRPNLWAVVSFADSTEGHVGYIYQALNAQFCGTTGVATFFRDGEGRLRHPRQSGVNISREEARRRGWKPERREAKYRYMLTMPRSKRERRAIRERIAERYGDLPYPKH